MVLQAYVDDSYTENGVFVLAGYVATAAAWASFSQEWEKLLPTATRGPSGKFRFKMSEMANQINRVPAFHCIIENHVLMAISCKIDLGDLERAKQRIWSDNIQIIWGPPHNPNNQVIGYLLTHFHRLRYERQLLVNLLPLDEKVDFYFDLHSDINTLDWDAFVASETSRSIRELYGAPARFEDDEEFLPLQAADFLAWWIRDGYQNGRLQSYLSGDFGFWRGKKAIPYLNIMVSEDQLVEVFINQWERTLAPGSPARVFDANERLPTDNALPPLVLDRTSILKRMRRFLGRRSTGR